MQEYQKIGLERIEILANMCKKHPEHAKRYTYLMKKLSEKIGLPIPKEYKRWICKRCGEFLIPGRNCTVRLKDKTQYITCKECNTKKRLQYAI